MSFDFDKQEDTATGVKTSRFTFDTTMSDSVFKDKSSKLDILHEKISNLVSNATIEGQPVIRYIMQMAGGNPNPEELATLGRALIRIAEYMPKYQELDEEVKFMRFARTKPDAVALAFADFSVNVEDFIEGVNKPAS